jgi:hypothetical protein
VGSPLGTNEVVKGSKFTPVGQVHPQGKARVVKNRPLGFSGFWNGL